MKYKTKKWLSQGFYSAAYVLDDKYVQLIGIRSDSYKSYKDTKENLYSLKNVIKCVKIPKNIILVEPNEEFKFGSIVYPMIKGNVLKAVSLTTREKEKIAKKLVKFNKELHTANIHWDRDKTIINEMEELKRNIEILKDYLDKDEMSKLNQFKIVFENYLNNAKHFCITHCDLWSDNLIVNKKNKLIGVIDFGNISYSLPVVDYASMWNMMDGFLDMLIKHTEEDISIEDVYLFALKREVGFFEHVENLEESNYQLEKIRKLIKLIESQLTTCIN